jgi:predicted small lipoprotein YifL
MRTVAFLLATIVTVAACGARTDLGGLTPEPADVSATDDAGDVQQEADDAAMSCGPCGGVMTGNVCTSWVVCANESL